LRDFLPPGGAPQPQDARVDGEKDAASERVAPERPALITVLSLFFASGSLISAAAGVSLISPGGLFEPMWRLNPRARIALAGMGVAAPLLLAVVSVACAGAAFGLWHGRRWGYRLAIGLLAVNLTGDLINTILGTEPRAAVGIPIVAAILALLATGRVRQYFGGRV
jgi:hypothetical protein